MARAHHGLPPSHRLRLPVEFTATLKSRWRGRDDFFGVYAVPNPYPYGRLGIVVSRKVSPRAVVRNRIKRQIREQFRLHPQAFQGLDVVVVAGPKAATAQTALMRGSLHKLWEKLAEQCKKS